MRLATILFILLLPSLVHATEFKYGREVAVFLQPTIPQFKIKIYGFSVCGELLNPFTEGYEKEFLITFRLKISKKITMPIGYRFTYLESDYNDASELKLSHGPYLSIKFSLP